MESRVLVDPSRCVVWDMHDRLSEYITVVSCEEEIASFQKNGQFIPALGRPVANDPAVDIEIICGARRLFVARHLKEKLLVDVRELSDRDALVAMDAENRLHKDISPYERGVSYMNWIRSGHFGSQEELAHAIDISAAKVSRLLKLARLPTVIVDAFSAATEIHENWGLRLAALLSNPSARDKLILAARRIAAVTPRPPAREVYGELLASAANGRKVKQRSRDRVVKGHDGTPLYRVRYQRGSIAVMLPIERTSARSLGAIEQAIRMIVEGPPPEDVDREGSHRSIRVAREFEGA